MNKTTALIFRVTGILFFIINMMSVIEMISVNFSTFLYIASDESTRFWSIFFLITSFFYTAYFLFAIFGTGTAAIFAGKNGYTQSVWNCAVYSVVFLSMYTSLQLITGVESSDEQFFLIQSIIMNLIFLTIIFFCLKEEKDFSWKNILPTDPNSKHCLKVFLIMLFIVEAAIFLYSHFIQNQ